MNERPIEGTELWEMVFLITSIAQRKGKTKDMVVKSTRYPHECQNPVYK